MDASGTTRRDLQIDEITPLLRRCNREDAQAWDCLLAHVRRLALDLGRWKYHLGKEDAEDMAQVVQLRVCQRLPQLRNAAAFPSWVRRLTHRAAVDFMRQRRRTLSLDEPLPSGEAGGELTTVEPYEQIVLRADLDRALALLPPIYREPIELHLLEGMPQDEVGRLLGRPRSTVASQVERGLRRLQRSLVRTALA